MAIGGFINGLRPVNLAKLLLQKAGIDIRSIGPTPTIPIQPIPSTPSFPSERSTGPVFSALVFSRDVSDDGRPISPAAILPSGGTQLFASFEFSGISNDMIFGEIWAWNGQKIVQKREPWDAGSRGRRVLSLMNRRGLPDGEYHLVLTVNDKVISEGKVVVGKRAEDTDTQISGQIVDANTRKGIPDVLVIASRPDMRVQNFLQQKRREMIFTSARTDRNGNFTFDRQLPKGQSYGLVVVARGYRDLAIESALRVTANAPEQAQLDPIPLQRE